MAEQSNQNQSEQVAAMIARLSAAQSPAEQAAVVAEMAFEQMSEPIALVARRCVILRWFDEEIVEALLSESAELSAAKAFAVLQKLPFAEKNTHGWRYHDQTREGLLLQQQPDLLRESAMVAFSAYQESARSDSLLEALYCLVVAGQAEDAVSLLDGLILERALHQDWQSFDIILKTVEDAETLEFVDELTRLPLHYVAYGLARSNKGKLDEAIADFDKAIELNPKYATAYNNRGNARSNKGQLDEAIVDFDKAIELNPEYANAYNNRGNARREKGELEKAIADYDKAIELNPKDTIVYMNRGIARSDNGELQEAITDYDTASKLNPDNAHIHRLRGDVLSLLVRWEEARDSYRKAVALDSQTYLSYLGLATIARRNGELKTWQEIIDRARPFVDDSDLYNAACFESVAGNTEKAISLLQKALEQGTETPEWAKQDPDLEWIRDDPRFWEIVGDPK